MTWEYDPESGAPKDQIRLLIGDTDQANAENRYFEDEEIDSFLAMANGNVYLATAQALDTLASTEALILKKISILDLSTDGPAVAAELRARATELRSQAYDGDDNLPDWAELVLDPHTFDERVSNQAERLQ